jgi:hypothetical protein
MKDAKEPEIVKKEPTSEETRMKRSRRTAE